MTLIKKNHHQDLNDKQRKFILEYLQDFNRARAYVAAYGKQKNINSARASASRLLTNAIVLESIRRETNKLLGKLNITLEENLADLQNIKNMAIYNPKKQNLFAAIRAIEVTGKFLGFLKQEAPVDLISAEAGKVLILPENNRELTKDKVEQKNPDRKEVKKKAK